MTNFAFRIDTAEHYAVEQGINGAPHYNIRVANAVRRTIEVIHGLQDLHLRAGLDDIEVYLGRSSHSSDHVLSRWRSHREHRGHKFATVLFTCDAERAERLEGVAVKILKRLKNYGTLCVSNANVMGGGGGGLPATRVAVVYMTWRTGADPTEYQKPGVDVIRHGASEVSAAVQHVIAPRQLETGLMALKRLQIRAPMEWFPD